MFEKVNPKHPDKVADRIAGAIVDYAYTCESNPKIAVEVLIGHRVCHIIAETSVKLDVVMVHNIVHRIGGDVMVDYQEYPQDEHLADNQKSAVRCGDNGIFKGSPLTDEQRELSSLAFELYEKYDSDGKYIIDKNHIIICQSNASNSLLSQQYPHAVINPLGEWVGGTNVDTGATNRKLGSDMGDGVTGGGLHGKDLSKADVTINICLHLDAQRLGKTLHTCCAIGDDRIVVEDDKGKKLYEESYESMVNRAKQFITIVGGFEKFAEWGLI